MAKTPVAQASPASSSIPAHQPTSVEQEHIDQALQASQTAIDAISTITSVSTWALAIIGVGIAVIAIWGWKTLKDAADDKAEQIANAAIGAYIESKAFNALLKARIDEAVKAEWQGRLLKRVQEAVKDEGEQPPFPEKEETQ